MSKINEMLAAKLQENASAKADPEPVLAVYIALRAGRYSLGGKLESPDSNGFIVGGGSEERIADLNYYVERGLLVEQEQ